jgi:hypothetical protein
MSSGGETEILEIPAAKKRKLSPSEKVVKKHGGATNNSGNFYFSMH